MDFWNKIKSKLEKVLPFVKLLEYVASMMYMKTHLKYVLGFIGVFDLVFLFIVDIWNDMKKGPGSTLRSISWQTFKVSPASSDLVDLCTNI